jgi:aspartate racemase
MWLERQLLMQPAGPPPEGIVPRRQGGPAPLSFAQQRLWFLEQMEGALTAYNLPVAWRLRGPLNREALRRALEAIIRRHEPLRTTFAVVEEEPVQVIGALERFELPLEDLRGLATDQQAAVVVQRRTAEAERPFDLTRDLLLRASLLRLAEDEHVLLLTLHHIAADGWSVEVVLWRELRALYDASCRDEDAGLPELPVQYADYAVWQRKQLEGEGLAELLQYWREQLQGLSALELPTDRPRPGRPSYRGARHDFTLGPDLIRQLQALGQAEGVTLHMTLLAAFQALLARYSGQEDIAVGTPIAGRNHAALEDLIGFFVNTLVLRMDLAGDPTFRELLARVRQVSLAAYDHQDLPFEQLVEELRPARHLNRNPLVQVLFQLLSFSGQGLTLRDLEVLRLPQSSGRARFDLEMHVWQPAEREERLEGTVVYSTDLFDAATIERLVGHFVMLLEGVAADADQRLSALPLLTETERGQLLVEWNETAVAYPADKGVHQLFEEQVERTPGAVAVVFEGQELTYRELNERANQLAHHLRSLGVGPETLVGLCLERSPELVVGILGILKAGGAYVPLDRDYPLQRLEFMLTEARVGVLVTQHSLLGRLPATGCQVICLDTDAAKLQSEACSNPLLDVGADDLAYVLFTSGSTGQPKGVAVRHASIARLVFGNDYTKFGPDRVFLQLAPVSFDASTFELWGALLHGAKLVIAPPSLPDFRHLEELLQRHRVTTLWLTATLFNQVVDHYPQALRGVAEVLTGGEALSVQHICRAQATLGSRVQLINGYGPTECTTFATCYRIPPQLAPATASIPIGRPIANTQVYVLDKRRVPVPIGVPGELYLGGPGLARGYLNRPELTAECFVAHPFDDAPGARLYRTGDLCRWRADGNLEFLGRLDDQVKLRGYRIELGEIEAALNQHPAVAQSAVALREDSPGDKRLVAFFVSAGTVALDFNDLTHHLRTRLPGYMVPSAIVPLEAFPLTPSGKVNRQRLESLPLAWAPPTPERQVPRNPMEAVLHAVWRELLNGRPFGVRDDFFALGGHSLLAVTMVARVEQLCGRKLPLAKVFERATIEHLSQVLLQEPEVRQEESLLVKVQAGGDKRPLFFLHGDFLGGGFYCLKLARQLGADQPFYALSPHGVSGPRLLTTVQAMAADHLERVRSVQPDGPYLLGGYCHGALVSFEMAQQLHAQGQKVDLLVLLDPMPVELGVETPALPEQLEDRLNLQNRALYDRRRIATDVCYHVCRRYVPRCYPGQLTILQPRQRLLGSEDPSRGWKGFAQRVEVHLIPGNHLTCLTAHAKAVGEELRNCLQQAGEAADCHKAPASEPIHPLLESPKPQAWWEQCVPTAWSAQDSLGDV